ncbi:hypothetical protein NM688_g9294 [Phlebia brevispora]|uniref:Uncharacterized protein n=1 Tax=Phlebia brevispora TaxID=194682 RepID=A0ACC1RHD3_9APHY|nr:hypothetical protein NM688_g9294 [Phlebia brevispora]
MEIRPETAPHTLQEIIYVGDMLNPIENIIEQRLSRIVLDWDDQIHKDFIGSVSPWHTTPNLPPSINSEKDVEDWGTYANLAPVARLLDSIKHRRVRPRPLNTAQVLPVDAPNVTSSDGEDGVIPDSVIVDEKGDVMAVVEFKAEPVINRLQRGKCFGITSSTACSDIMRSTGDKTNVTLISNPDTQTKILVQVWTQMVIKKVNYAMLSSFNSTIYFYKEGQRLYMSRTYNSADNILLATLSWMMLAFGLADPKDMHLPEVNNTWYKDDPNISATIVWAEWEGSCGIVPAYVHLAPLST